MLKNIVENNLIGPMKASFVPKLKFPLKKINEGNLAPGDKYRSKGCFSTKKHTI